MKKYFLFIILLLCLTSCTFSHTKDTNGPENFTIQTFTDEEILTNNTNLYSHSRYSRSETKFNIEYGGTAKKYSGVDEIEEYNNSSSFTLTLTNNVESGNFCVVIIYNNTIIDRIPANTTYTKNFLESGKYLIKIVGESAKFDITFTITK